MDSFIGEIRAFAGNFAPTGWALCNGQLLPIAQNTALFSLLGTFYGGDGRSTFALPDLRTRFPMHAGSAPGLTPRNLGESGGQAQVALTAAQMPPHGHALGATPAPDSGQPGPGQTLASATPVTSIYRIPGAVVNMDVASLGATGGSAAHENRQPYLALTFIIALQGVFPPRA